ncbi:MAG: hypothetical protein AAGD12_15350, partial [Pseudomonadota bacterium]
EAPTGAPSEDPAKITDDSVVIAAPGPDATLRAAQEDLTPTAQARAEADLPRPRPARQAPTPGRNTAALAASPVSAAATPQPGLGEARWIGSTDAAPADPTGAGVWIASDMIEAATDGWAADEATGRLVRLQLRPALPDQRARAVMSREAMAALGLVPGQYAALSLYVPRDLRE